MSSMARDVREGTVTIASAGTESEAFEVGDSVKGSYFLPATWNGVELKIQVSNDGATWIDAKDLTNTDIDPLVVVLSDYFLIPTEVFSFKWARIKATTEQSADTVIPFIVTG
jgi:hypothetical protein